MPQAVIGDIFECKVYCSAVDQLAVNVFHYRVAAVAGASVAENVIAAKFEAQVADEYIAIMSVNANFRGVGIRRLHPQPPTVDFYSNILADTGGIDADILPRQVSGIISKQTGFGGRKYRGRAYIPFPAETNNTVTGHPENAYVGALQVLANALEDSFTAGTAPNTATLIPILYHRLDGSWTTISNMLAKARWATQRRRGDFGQANTFPV